MLHFGSTKILVDVDLICYKLQVKMVDMFFLGTNDLEWLLGLRKH